jgi:hypothetical protein
MKEDFQSLSQFLKEHGVTKDTPLEVVEALKKEHKQAYHSWYHQTRRKQETHRFTLRFSKSEWGHLKQIIKRYAPADFPSIAEHIDMSQFIKKTLFAYITKSYVPRDPQPMIVLQKELQVIRNLLIITLDNTAKLAHQGEFREADFEKLQERISQMEKRTVEFETQFKGFIQSPPLMLKQALKEYLEDRPEKVGQLIEYLKSIKT